MTGLSHPLHKAPHSPHLIFKCSCGLGFLSTSADRMGGLAVGRSLRFYSVPHSSLPYAEP